VLSAMADSYGCANSVTSNHNAYFLNATLY
jgi:hypothetical protein